MNRIAAAIVIALGLVLIPVTASAHVSTGTWCQDKSRVAILGASDSTSYGTTGYAPAVPDEYDETRYGWASRVARNAKAEWGTQVDVYAHNGALMTDWQPGGRWPTTVNAVDNVAATQPDLVIIGGALVNEYVNNMDPVTAQSRLENLVNRIRQARPGVDVLLITYPNIQWSSANRPWSDYTAKIHQTAVATSSGLLDLQQYIDSPQATAAAGIWHSDDAHLLDAGQAAESAAVWTLLWHWALTC